VQFTLRKWYLDVVTEAGRVGIAYWVSVHAGPASYAVCGLLRAGSAEASQSFSLRASHGPRLLNDRLVWRAPSLDLDISLLRVAPEFSRRLLDTPDGAVDWTVWAPAAAVRFTVGDEVLTGEGYVERLDLSLPPWAIPVREFHWGRFVSDSRSLVWLKWEGEHPLALAWLDGVPVADPRIEVDGVALGSAGGLAIAERTVVTDATIGEQLTSLAPLQALVDNVASSHQTRWLSRGTLTRPGAPPLDGWVVHEVVRWR